MAGNIEQRLQALEQKAINSKKIQDLDLLVGLNGDEYLPIKSPLNNDVSKIASSNFLGLISSKKSEVKTFRVDPNNLAQIISEVNGAGAFILDNPENTLIKAVFISEQGQPFETSTRVYQIITNPNTGLNNLIAGNFGTGGQQINFRHLELIYASASNSGDIQDLDDTQIIQFFDIGSTIVLDHINDLDPSITFVNPNTNLTIITAVVNGLAVEYLYTGIGDTYGLNSSQISSDELLLIEAETNDFGSDLYVNTSLVPETIGGYIEGEPITPLEGLTQSQFNDKFFTNIILPTISFNTNSQIIEKGADFAQTINIVFAPNDAEATGATFSLEKDEVEVSATQSTEFEAINVVSNFTLQGFVSYAANSVLSSGIISTPLRTITQRLKFWYGALSAIPTNSTQVRAIANDVWDNVNTITLETGTTEKIFVVARPTSGGTQASLPAQDITNNVSYTYDFESTIDVVLPNTTTEEYRIYVLEVDNAYTTNAQHLIQI